MTTEERIERQKMIVAMDFIASHINDEDVLDGWLMNGVPDGMLNDSLDPTQIDDDDWLITDGFVDVMTCFTRRMSSAYLSGGLYCGGVCSREKSEER